MLCTKYRNPSKNQLVYSKALFVRFLKISSNWIFIFTVPFGISKVTRYSCPRSVSVDDFSLKKKPLLGKIDRNHSKTERASMIFLDLRRFLTLHEASGWYDYHLKSPFWLVNIPFLIHLAKHPDHQNIPKLSGTAPQLPTEIDEKSYTVLDTSEGLVMLHVNHGAKEVQWQKWWVFPGASWNLWKACNLKVLDSKNVFSIDM